METNKIYQGDAIKCLKELPNESINCVMTSPPYWALRDYGGSVETIWDVPKKYDEFNYDKEGFRKEEEIICKHEWLKLTFPPRGGEGKNSIVGSNKNSKANN